DVQDAIRVSQHRHRAGTLLWRRLPRLEPGVEGLNELEEVTDGRGQVEVVFKRIVPPLSHVGRGLSLCGYGTEADCKFIQPFDSAVRCLQQLWRKRKRAPVMRAR